MWEPRSAPALRFAIVTPSYYVDFEPCRLLAESVLRFTPPHVEHLILVDARDERLFSSLRSPRTHLVIKEELLPSWLVQLPYARRWWLSARSLPVRGWIVQQLTKLAVSQASDADVFIFLDSGAFFVRPYDPASLLRNGTVPLFREEGPQFETPHNQRWHRDAARLLGLRTRERYRTSYVANLVFWRRENLIMLQRHLEHVSGQMWMEPLVRLHTLSEYVLYGQFCEEVLGESAGHHPYSTINAYSYWADSELGVDALRHIKDELTPEQAVVMINEKSHTPLTRIREVFVASA